MNGRDLIRNIIAGKPGPRCGFWLGNPHFETWPILHKYFGTRTEEELRRKLGDDYRWISPQFVESEFLPPADGRSFGFAKPKLSHGQVGPLADVEDPAELDRFDWPDPEVLDFERTIRALEAAGPHYRASGFWCPFFHDVMDLFGMEGYFVKMTTNPTIVRAVTDRVCGFYDRANERFFSRARGLVDGFFFGNDFGTQLDAMLGPAHFDAFVQPWLWKLAEQARRYGHQVILHSCGSIHRVIGPLIEAGVQGLHPLQAGARNMDAGTLARDFKGRIAFLGGIDTQRLLNMGTPAEVREEVRRVKGLLGPCLVVSPSHEALLPDVPPRNVAAMAEAALESL